ncbi:MAG: HAD hydrolase family protein [Coxiellaceae bacterium]|nr:HAD hydrolase family protein [Coxiellaceae bacterium]
MGLQALNLKDIHTVVFDFDGVFTDNKVYVDETGRESVRCDRADGLAIDFLREYKKRGKLKADFFILSTEKNPVVAMRAKKLQLEYKQGVGNKLLFLRTYFAEKRPNDDHPFNGLIYLGNDLNDLQAIQAAKYSVVPNDAHSMIKSAATKVMPQNGGEGFVRAFVEDLLNINNDTRFSMREIIHA